VKEEAKGQVRSSDGRSLAELEADRGHLLSPQATRPDASGARLPRGLGRVRPCRRRTPVDTHPAARSTVASRATTSRPAGAGQARPWSTWVEVRADAVADGHTCGQL